LPEKILSKNRLIYLDLLKVVALIVMIYDHTLKFLIPVDKTDLFKAEIALDKYAPLASALFLCIAGYNLASSYQRQTHFQTWLVKKPKYGLILIATSFFVAIITNSSHTNFFATGILQTIGLSLLMGIGLHRISISDK